MEFSLDRGTATYQIQAYEPGCITVSGEKIAHSILILAEHLISPWEPGSLELMKAEDIERILTFKPEVVIIGTGHKMQRPSLEVLRPLIDQNIGFEIMDTKAACRTYTLLMSEDRKVAALLIL